MNKKRLVEHLTRQISDELAALIQAAKNTYDVATHEDNKPENKYDTRGLEASYLAGAQAKRVNDMQEVLAIFENLPLKEFNDDTPIGLTALVQVSLKEKTHYVLLMPKGGGQSTVFENATVQVITRESPLGQALLGRHTGDLIEIETGRDRREYEVLSVV